MNKESKVDLRRLSDAFIRFSRTERKKQPLLELKQSEIRVLCCIKAISNKADCAITVSEISKQLFVTSPTITELVKGLSSKGYIERRTNLQDKRVADLKLTDKGEKIVEKVLASFTSFFSGLVDKLGEEKCLLLIELLEEVCEYIDDMDIEVSIV